MVGRRDQRAAPAHHQQHHHRRDPRRGRERRDGLLQRPAATRGRVDTRLPVHGYPVPAVRRLGAGRAASDRPARLGRRGVQVRHHRQCRIAAHSAGRHTDREQRGQPALYRVSERSGPSGPAAESRGALGRQPGRRARGGGAPRGAGRRRRPGRGPDLRAPGRGACRERRRGRAGGQYRQPEPAVSRRPRRLGGLADHQPRRHSDRRRRAPHEPGRHRAHRPARSAEQHAHRVRAARVHRRRRALGHALADASDRGHRRRGPAGGVGQAARRSPDGRGARAHG